MNKNNYLKLILYLLFPVIFNILFFLLGEIPDKLSIWVSYLFIHLAYLFLVASPYLTPKSKSRALFASTLSMISSLHFIITLIIGIVFILSNPDSYKTNGTIHLIITGIYFLIFLLTMLANENTSESEKNAEQGLKYIKDGSSLLQELKSLSSDIEIKRIIQNIYDILHSSPIKTTEEAMISEEIVLELLITLKTKIKSLDREEVKKNLSKIMEHINERNRILKYNK